jgi:hypothetical protein
MAGEPELRDSRDNGGKNRGMETGGVEEIFLEPSVRWQKINSQKQWQLQRDRFRERKASVIVERGF